MLFLNILDGWPITLIVLGLIFLVWIIRDSRKKKEDVATETKTEPIITESETNENEEIVAAITAAIYSYYQAETNIKSPSKLTFKIKKKE